MTGISKDLFIPNVLFFVRYVGIVQNDSLSHDMGSHHNPPQQLT